MDVPSDIIPPIAAIPAAARAAVFRIAAPGQRQSEGTEQGD